MPESFENATPNNQDDFDPSQDEGLYDRSLKKVRGEQLKEQANQELQNQESGPIDIRSQAEVVKFTNESVLENLVKRYWDVFKEMAEMSEQDQDEFIKNEAENINNNNRDQTIGNLTRLQVLIRRIRKYNKTHA